MGRPAHQARRVPLVSPGPRVSLARPDPPVTWARTVPPEPAVRPVLQVPPVRLDFLESGETPESRAPLELLDCLEPPVYPVRKVLWVPLVQNQSCR